MCTRLAGISSLIALALLWCPAQVLAASGSPTIAAAQTISSGDENTGDGENPYFRVQLFQNDRVKTDIAYTDSACLLEDLLYDPSVTDFNVDSSTPVRSYALGCAGNSDYEWTWISPFSGLGTFWFDAWGGETYTFTTTIRHGTTTALDPLPPIIGLGSAVRLRGTISSHAGTAAGYCEFFRRKGRGSWSLRRSLPTGRQGGCATTFTPGRRGHWHYKVVFTSNGGDWVTSVSPVRSTRVR